MSKIDIVRFEDVKRRIIKLRETDAILDSDVAELYGVEVKRINEAARNNPNKFPSGYILELQKEEWDVLKSKFSTSIKGGKTKLPKAFTEKGMSNVSPRWNKWPDDSGIHGHGTEMIPPFHLKLLTRNLPL